VFNASGAPVEAMVRLTSESVGIATPIDGGAPPPGFMLNADTGRDGTFTIENVPPGPYVLIANSSFQAGLIAGVNGADPDAGRKAIQTLMDHGPETAAMSLIVTGDDVSGLALTTRLGGVLKGTFVAAQGVTEPLPINLQVTTRSTSADSGMMMMQGVRVGEFQLSGMAGPFFLDVLNVPAGWAVSQITVDGADVTDEPIELKGRTSTARVVLTNRITAITGTVQTRRNPSGYSVIVFPDDATRWAYPSRYVKTTRADERGAFRIEGLPANERYLVMAIDFLEDGEEQDPQFLERLRSRATTFPLSEGEQRSVYLDPVAR
jgi:hypothetical protein